MIYVTDAAAILGRLVQVPLPRQHHTLEQEMRLEWLQWLPSPMPCVVMQASLRRQFKPVAQEVQLVWLQQLHARVLPPFPPPVDGHMQASLPRQPQGMEQEVRVGRLQHLH